MNQRGIGRPGDIAGRYGGEQFCVLLLGTDLPGARRLAETLCQAIADLREPHRDAGVEE